MTQKQTITIYKPVKRPSTLNFSEKIGTTTYIVNANFDDKAKQDMVMKVKNILSR